MTESKANPEKSKLLIDAATASRSVNYALNVRSHFQLLQLITLITS